MKTTIKIRDFYGRIMGTVESDEAGNKVARDFYRRIVGRYDVKTGFLRANSCERRCRSITYTTHRQTIIERIEVCVW